LLHSTLTQEGDRLRIIFAEDQAPSVLAFTKTTTFSDIVIELTNLHPYLSPELHNLGVHIQSMKGPDAKQVDFENLWPYEDELVSDFGLQGEVKQ
jgi:hypothetical protein